uniref:NADH dehydrogenase subunit 3 n=1 Tax=Cissites auriculata TaxID=1288037 RepID=UPI001FA6C87B|nr:NADH dehydrogenase subunit 3 [Cissites auriculata]UMR54827.1 NADH dehydrogenase subunit 3 [Cissites auriculata]
MFNLTIMMFVITMIAIFMMLIVTLISKKTWLDREKSSPFECGFDPVSTARLPFSLHFFLIAVIFLIFDVEITLLFPLIKSLSISNIFNHMIVTTSFIFILIVGLIHEWSQGALNWTN